MSPKASDAPIEMPALTSVQRAHDALLADMPEGVKHDDCPLCQPDTPQAEMEVAQVPDETPKNVYTEDQHFALLTAAVERETSSLTVTNQELEGQVTSLTQKSSELETRVDSLEAEKVSLEKARDEAVQALESFKTELTELASIEARKADRVAAIKAANEDLPEEYFTEARAQRWAEMADEQFASTVEDMREVAAAAKAKKPAAEDEGAEKVAEKARETAAFTGGDTPSAGEGSLAGQFLRATGHGPALKA